MTALEAHGPNSRNFRRETEGRLDPVAAEIVEMHAGVYRTREAVGSVIHTHSPAVTSFAVANKPLPNAYEAMLRFGFTSEVPVAPWAPRGSKESVSNIIDQLRGHPDTPAVLLGNHGLLAFQDDPVSTARLIVNMEEGAEAPPGASVGRREAVPGRRVRVGARTHGRARITLVRRTTPDRNPAPGCWHTLEA